MPSTSKFFRAINNFLFGDQDRLAELQEAYRQAEEANLAMTRFLAVASRDLRQPLFAQGQLLEVLADTPLSREQKAVLASARAAAEDSAGMLDTLAEFSRIEAGEVHVRIQAFRLQPLLDKIETEMAPLAFAKGLDYRTRKTGLVVRSDPALVEQVLRQLVANAIRFSARGGILVGCRLRAGAADSKRIMLETWDTGIGIARSQFDEVFREFHQLANPERDRRKGLGLGLAIAAGLVKQLGRGHAIELSSREGQGSVFRLLLPEARIAGIPR